MTRWTLPLLVAPIVFAVVVLASCAAAQKGGTGPTEPASSTHNGKIAFAGSDSRGQSHIFLVETDGTGVRKLATEPALDNFPAWSADGKKLTFEASEGPNDYNIDIYAMNADGSGLERITKEPTPHGPYDSMLYRMPSWSPDGKRIAFLRGQWKPFAKENVGASTR